MFMLEIFQVPQKIRITGGGTQIYKTYIINQFWTSQTKN